MCSSLTTLFKKHIGEAVKKNDIKHSVLDMLRLIDAIAAILLEIVKPSALTVAGFSDIL